MPVEYLSFANIEEGVLFAEKSHVYSAWKDYPFDRDVLRANLIKMINNPSYFTCIYRKNGQIIGYWFATLGSFLFSDVLLGMENGIYIEKEHRGGMVAYSMYQEFIRWCETMKVEPFVEIYFGKDEDNEKVYNFFRKAGMIECGRVFRGGKNGLRK